MKIINKLFCAIALTATFLATGCNELCSIVNSPGSDEEILAFAKANGYPDMNIADVVRWKSYCSAPFQ